MKISVHGGNLSYCYPVSFTRGVFDASNSALEAVLHVGKYARRRGIAVIDTGAAKARPDLVSNLRDYFFVRGEKTALSGEPVLIPGGRAVTRNPVWAERVRDRVLAYDLDSLSFVMAVGGGAFLDAVGAAVGSLPFAPQVVRIPTTPAAQCRAAYAVTHRLEGRSRSATRISHSAPGAVVNDAEFFTSISEADRRAAIGELVRTAVLFDGDFFESLERAGELLLLRRGPWGQLVRAAAEVHLAIGADISKGGLQRTTRLRYEGWLARALLDLSPLELREGEALAAGAAFDCLYASKIGLMPPEQCERVLSLLESVGCRVAFPPFGARLEHPDDPESVLAGIQTYAREWGGGVQYTLPAGIGRAKPVGEISYNVAVECLVELLERQASSGSEIAKAA